MERLQFFEDGDLKFTVSYDYPSGIWSNRTQVSARGACHNFGVLALGTGLNFTVEHPGVWYTRSHEENC